MNRRNHGPFERIAAPDDLDAFSIVAAVQAVSAEELTAVLGDPCKANPRETTAADREGVLWAMRYPCGMQLVYRLEPGESVAIVLADALEISHAIRHIPLVPDRVRAVVAEPPRETSPSGEETTAPAKWQVYRQDDVGNQFPVGDPTTERDAACWVEHLESHGHKQTYWRDLVL
ncbi:MAG: hypothetical protein N2C14_18455 [Planctomycetales bacterium]